MGDNNTTGNETSTHVTFNGVIVPRGAAEGLGRIANANDVELGDIFNAAIELFLRSVEVNAKLNACKPRIVTALPGLRINGQNV